MHTPRPLDWKSLALTVLVFALLSGFALRYMYRSDASSIYDAILVREHMHNNLNSKILTLELKDLFVDLRLLARHGNLVRFFESRDPAVKGKLEEEFINLCEVTQAYDQVRILDLKGMELIRVNNNNARPAAVDDAELQDKHDRYYFVEAMKLGQNAVYVSPFDLNVENGALEMPHKPMLRVCMPLYDHTGTRYGILILNYLGQRILDKLMKSAEDHTHTLLLNMDGYWLLSPDKDQEWGFMFEDRQSVSFAAAHPDEWARIRGDGSGQFAAPDGLYTFSTIEVTPEGSTPMRVEARRWKVVCLLPRAEIEAGMAPLRETYLTFSLGALLIILFGAVTRARYVQSRKLAAAQLEQARLNAEEASRAKGDFLARMSHEIRTPMNAILGLTHLALNTDLTPKQLDYLRKTQMAAQSLLGIINDILDFSKIEANRLDIESVEFVLDDVLNTISGILGLQAEKNGLDFLMMVDSDVPNYLVGDPLRLGQVLLNLTGNAIKFTKSGEVVLSAETESTLDQDTVIRFSVRDTGIGMDEQQLQSLFEPFTQADVSISRTFGGTGLGLAICNRLVKLMGGRMSVTSALGQGSTFTLSLPFSLQANKSNAYLAYPSRLQGLRILVVDGKKISRDILTKTLRSFAFDTQAAPDGHQALRMLADSRHKTPYGLVITDLRLPGMDGLELGRKIKTDAELSPPPKVILATAYGQEGVLRRAEQLGLDGFILKPFNRSLLFDTLMNLFVKDGEPEAGPRKNVVDDAEFASVAGARVLVAEDNDINQQVAREILEQAGIRVDIACNGDEALKMLGKTRYDLVLMDIQMPVMNGLEAVRRIRENPEWRDLPVIAMTAHALAGEKEKSLMAGMNDHVTKPIDPNLLLRTIASRLPLDRVATGPEEPAAQPPAPGPDHDFPPIPGIDVQEGLSRIRGNQSLYIQLLTRFADDLGERNSPLIAQAARGEFDEARATAHRLKGVAGNIGAAELFALLSGIEAMLKQGETVPEDRLQAYREERDRVAAGIIRVLGRQEEAGGDEDKIDPGSIDGLLPRLSDLQAHSKQHDMDAITLFNEIRPELAEAAPALARELAQALEAFDFARCVQALGTFFQKLEGIDHADD